MNRSASSNTSCRLMADPLPSGATSRTSYSSQAVGATALAVRYRSPRRTHARDLSLVASWARCCSRPPPRPPDPRHVERDRARAGEGHAGGPQERDVDPRGARGRADERSRARSRTPSGVRRSSRRPAASRSGRWSRSPTAARPTRSVRTSTARSGRTVYCGNVANYKTVTRNGRRQRVRVKGTHRVCRYPRQVYAGAGVTFTIGWRGSPPQRTPLTAAPCRERRGRRLPARTGRRGGGELGQGDDRVQDLGGNSNLSI